MILIDTCAIVWDALDPEKLTAKAKKAIKDHHNELIISDISFWEISMMIKKGRIEIDSSSSEFTKLLIQARNYHVQEITPEIAELSVNFGTEINKDPADRLISATSILHNAPIVTADINLREVSILETIW